MGRPKKQLVAITLTLAEKKYIDLSLKTSNNINYDELFKKLSIELDRSEDVIRGYADKLTPHIVDQQLPPEPKQRVISPQQEMLRDLLTPNRIKEPNKARHVTVMSEGASETIDQLPPAIIKGSSKLKDCIYRQ